MVVKINNKQYSPCYDYSEFFSDLDPAKFEYFIQVTREYSTSLDIGQMLYSN